MDAYILILTLTGLAMFAMAWMPAFTKRTGISYSVVYVALGALLYAIAAPWLPIPLPDVHDELTLHLAELVVIISLMGTGIRIDRRFSFRTWRSPLRLITLAMLLCIGVMAVMGHYFLGLAVPSAILLAAALAPTDPVLASDVQVGAPNEHRKFETKFALTAEAGMNDGAAFPFVWLAIVLAGLGGSASLGADLGKWFAYDVLYRIGAGLLIGYLMGRGAAVLLLKVSEKYKLVQKNDGFVAISLTLLVYGVTELAHGYGFIAVFFAAISFRHFEKEHEFHDELHHFTDQAERIFIAVMLILLGGSLQHGLLDALTWRTAALSLVFLLIVRPVAAYISLTGVEMKRRERLAISFYGIRGMGSIFYVAFAVSKASFERTEEIWAAVGFTILLSAAIHGFTATRVMRRLKDSLPVEKIPE